MCEGEKDGNDLAGTEEAVKVMVCVRRTATHAKHDRTGASFLFATLGHE
jgi:hypothetical protein